MKKRTVITTEKLEVWIIPQPSDVSASVVQAPGTESWNSESGGESLTPSRQEHQTKNAPPIDED